MPEGWNSNTAGRMNLSSYEAHSRHAASSSSGPPAWLLELMRSPSVLVRASAVLAVAGIARHEPIILVFGLALSVALMAFGATLIARLLERYAWIAYIGLVVILQVALVMIWEGSRELIVLAQA